MEEFTRSSSREMETEEVDAINFDVLHPENPLMIRFQNALSQMLEKKLNNLQEDLTQIQNETKKKRQEKEDLCEIIYNQKSELLKIENSVCKYNELISDVIEQRKDLKRTLSSNAQRHEKENDAMSDERRLNIELQHKVGIQSRSLNQLQKYEQAEASNLRIIERAISKNKADQVIYWKEKVQKDCLLMKLENEVFKLELLIKNHKEQITVENENLNKLHKNLALKESDYEEIERDNCQLLSVWKHLIVLISKRDEEFSNLKMQLDKAEIFHNEKIIEMNNFKEMSEKEMLRNEILTSDRNRKKSFLNSLERDYMKMKQKLNVTELELSDLENMIECTKKILEETQRKQVDYDRELLVLEYKLKKLTNEKYQLEEDIISQLQNEVVSNNATVRLNEDICKLRQNSLLLELHIKELNTIYFKTCTVLEEEMNLMESNCLCSEKNKTEIRVKEKEILKIEEELKNLELIIKKEENRLDDCTKQLIKLIEHPNACPELDDKENRNVIMLKKICDEIETQKQLWIQKQNEIMTLTEKKTQIVSEINQLNQHLNLLHQKNSRIDKNIKKTWEIGEKLDKSITHVLNYISKINNECSIRRDQENILDSKNCSTQNRAMEKLQEAESKVYILVQEIDDLKKKKEFFENEMLNAQREDLEWEKKVKLAIEMKQEILTEQSEKGDIGSMKNEIHRMEIRYAQLKKAQDDLISNLETCISKRDRIFDDVVLKDKKQADLTKQQQKLIRHLNVLGNKNSKLKEKLECLKNEYSSLCEEKEKLSIDLKDYQAQIEVLQHEIKDLDIKIQEYHLIKHKNLETLVRKQKFADFLFQIKSGKIRTVSSNEVVIERDFMKHQYLRQDLLDTMELVIKENPEFRDDLVRIVNILQSHGG